MPLSSRRRDFVKQYLLDLDPEAAALRAGYRPQTARQAARFLKEKETKNAIAEAQADRAARVGVEADHVLVELAKIAFADPGDYFDWGPEGLTVIPSSQLTEAQRSAIAEVTQSSSRDGATIKIKLHDRQRALEYLGRHLGLFDGKSADGDLPAGLADRIRDARRRAHHQDGEPALKRPAGIDPTEDEDAD